MNVIVDYFQPINTSHLQVAQKLYEKNGRRAILVAVSHPNRPARYPLPSDTVSSMMDEAREKYDCIIDTFVVADWKIESIIEVLKGKYFPTIIACTSKRIKDYSLQLEFHLRYHPKSPIKKTLLVEVDHNDFSDDLQLSLIERKLSIFKQKTPEFIHNRFEELTSYYSKKDIDLSKDNQSKLKDHFQFLKMVINDDSSVDIQPWLVDALDTAKKRFGLKDEEDYIKDRIISRGFTEAEATEFLDRVISKWDHETVCGFTSKLEQGHSLSLGRRGLIRLNESFEGWNIDREFIREAINFKPTGRDNFGGGEFLTTILFNGAYKADVGDVMIDDLKIEVKNNDAFLFSSRSLNGQNPYTDLSVAAGHAAYMLIEDFLIERLSKRTPKALRNKIWKTCESQDYGINQKGLKNYIIIIKELIKIHGEEESDYFYVWLASIIRGAGGVMSNWHYLNNTTKGTKLEDQLEEMIELTVNDEMTVKELLCYITWMAFKYYCKLDGLKGMLVYRSNSKKSTFGYVAYIPDDISFTQYLELIEPVTGPSMTDPRTSKAFKIRLKDVSW